METLAYRLSNYASRGFPQLLEVQVLAELHRREFKRAESGLDEIEPGVGGPGPVLASVSGHIVRQGITRGSQNQLRES